MVKVFYVEEVRKIEELTLEHKQITNKELMYQAGYVLAKDFLSRMMPNVTDEILVIANTGNNGGDALVVFQELKKLGYNAKLYIVGNKEKMTDSFKYYYDNLETKVENKSYNQWLKEIKNAKFIIEGIFGIGLNKDISGDLKLLINDMNKFNKNVYSIDIPSGINADTGEVMSVAVKAKFTGVLGVLKLGNLLNDALDYHGELKVLDIGLLEGYSDIYYLDYKDIDVSRIRLHNSHKYTYGKNAFIGSSNMPGAINLSAMAALRSGLGLAEVFYDEDIYRHNLEIIYKKLNKDQDFSSYDVIVFGPGLTEEKDIYKESFDKIEKSSKKIVLDAGGIKYLNLKQKHKNLLITPHLNELSQLLKVERDLIKKNPVHYLRDLANKGIITLLKGPTTIIQEQRYTYLLQAKNTGLATAGSGDVLAGIISAFLVDETMINATVKAFTTHAKAADYARKRRSEVSLIASDIIDNLYKVWLNKR
ncbi:MAG: NAD(P)H-hydrate dehydratase [Candidatus Izemoplasmatales bacterium]|jgi:NAD(P)H-hydrate epimerase|nr:NAD(P)H-hydrate dehydratase [Candidatus Izemoplasmatales bacterium]